MERTLKLQIAALICFSLTPSAMAQNYEAMMQQNMYNMQAAEMQMQQMMRDTEMKAMAAERQYIEQNRPQLEAEHRQFVQQTGMQVSLEQYVHNKIMEEAARRNNAMNAQAGSNPMFEQQKRMFEAGQKAHQARQQGFDAQNRNWAQGQQQIENNNQAWREQQRQIDSGNSRFIQQGIQGNQYYRNAETGDVAELPFAGGPGVYQGNDNTWISDKMGQYKQVDPNGMPQEMEEFQPQYFGEE